MSQDTRKDPRAKVLTMTVRYKSATLDEFIEHHSYDVSRGGMFIKTPQPFPPGTLLKFEVKIAADQKVIQGVGRVVWKRDSETNGDARPAGMGVKFIKIDDASRTVIDALVESRGDTTSAYEAGGGDGADPSKALNLRKATMIGLGGMNPPSRPQAGLAPEKPAPAFFPEYGADADMPPPEDRTVIKQAAELLKDALREAGGSMEEVGSASHPADAATKASLPVGDFNAPPSAPSAQPPESSSRNPPAALDSRSDKSDRSDNSDKSGKSDKPLTAQRPTAGKPALGAGGLAAAVKPVSSKPSAANVRRPVASTVPASRRASVPVAAAASSKGSGVSRVLVIALVLAATAGLVYAFSSQTPPAPAPAASTVPTPEPIPSEAPPIPAQAESAAPTPSAVPALSATPVARATSTAAPLAAAPAARTSAPSARPPAPKAAVLPLRPAAKPKPATVPAPSPPSEPIEPSAPTAPAAPTAEKPTAPVTPAPAPTPKPEAPAAKPKPGEPVGDNPY